jgi:hypothetical protein
MTASAQPRPGTPAALAHPGAPAALARPGALVALAACLGALVVGLGGCAPDEVPDPPPARAFHAHVTEPPKPGDCWQQPDYGVASDWGWWQGDPAVDCAEEHNSITVAVADLDPAFAYPRAETGERRELADQEFAAVAAICDEAIGTDVGMKRGSRVTWFWYVPPPKEWAAGERWVRCDIGVTPLGPLEPPALEPLPPTASEVVSRAFDDYRLCMNTPYPPPDTGDLLDLAANVAVPCDAAAQWEFGVSVEFPDGELPAEIDMGAEIIQACDGLLVTRPDRTGSTMYTPNAEGWAQGNRTATCWLY